MKKLKTNINIRFEKYFSIPYTRINECWECKGGKTKDGYGKFWLGKTMKSHKVSYLIYRGEIAHGRCVLHKCDNRKCVNPKHLWLGTQKENIQDMIKKGRAIKATGERNGGAKLRWQEVTEIRDLYKTGRFSYNDFARKYHVSESTIKRLMTNKTWK